MITKRKQDFIDHYVQLKNATEAAKRAGYSVRTAYSQGQRLLKRVDVKAAIEAVFEAERARLSITKDKVLENLWKEALNADRAADRIAANLGVAKINKYIQDNAGQAVAVFNGLDITKGLPGQSRSETEQAQLPVDKPVNT